MWVNALIAVNTNTIILAACATVADTTKLQDTYPSFTKENKCT
jgi:hypothetical protein